MKANYRKVIYISKILSILIQVVSSEISSFGNGSRPTWIEKRVPVSLSYLSGWEIADIWRQEVPFFRYFREPRVPPYQLDAIFLVRFFIPPLWNIKSRFVVFDGACALPGKYFVVRKLINRPNFNGSCNTGNMMVRDLSVGESEAESKF